MWPARWRQYNDRMELSNDKPGAEELGWELVESQYPVATPWMTVRSDQLEAADRGRRSYAYVQAPPAVFIVPVTAAGEMILIRQYRYPVDTWCLEVPAGGTFDRPGESLAEVARAELHEEIGAVCEELLPAGWFYAWVARSDQVAHVFLATRVQITSGQQLEATEAIELVPMRAAEVVDLVRRGQIKDGQSALAILLCENLLRAGGYLG